MKRRKGETARKFWSGKLTATKRASLVPALLSEFDARYTIYKDVDDGIFVRRRRRSPIHAAHDAVGKCEDEHPTHAAHPAARRSAIVQRGGVHHEEAALEGGRGRGGGRPESAGGGAG